MIIIILIIIINVHSAVPKLSVTETGRILIQDFVEWSRSFVQVKSRSLRDSKSEMVRINKTDQKCAYTNKTLDTHFNWTLSLNKWSVWGCYISIFFFSLQESNSISATHNALNATKTARIICQITLLKIYHMVHRRVPATKPLEHYLYI